MKLYRNVLILIALVITLPLSARAEVRTIVFPIDGGASFRNDFRDPRAGGTREHLGTDVFAPKMTPLVSTVDGVVSYVVRPEANWGYSITIQDSDGYQYRYLHMNNDTPGTDDGNGGDANAYAGSLKRGTVVTAGQLLGWVGDSGNAEGTPPHVHFEIRNPDRLPINPYDSLSAAVESSRFASSISIGSGTTATHTSSGELGVARGAEFVFTIELREDMQGEAIRALQSRLRDGGYFTYYKTTKYFGPITKIALEKYQAANNIAPTGVLGFETRELLNGNSGSGGSLRLKENLFEGARGEAVQQVQFKLEALGYFGGFVTSYYGEVTREAVRKFQNDNKLLGTGFVDQNTWNTLNKVYAKSSVKAVSLGDQSLPTPYIFKLSLSIGSESDEVVELQKELQGLGFFSKKVQTTGYFGPITKAAVADFQLANDIESIGIVGPKTRAALNTL